MELRIDRQAMVPVVQQIVDGLTDWILQSGVPPATRLPSVRQIARGNLLSQSCVVEACERLVAQGVLYACDPRARQFFRNTGSDRPQVF